MAIKQMCAILVAQIQSVLLVKLLSLQDFLCCKRLSDLDQWSSNKKSKLIGNSDYSYCLTSYTWDSLSALKIVVVCVCNTE